MLEDKNVARVSIINPANFNNRNRIAEIIAEIKEKINEVYIYDCPMGLIIFDKYIDPINVKNFYNEIIDYKQGIGENLTRLEKSVREKEVAMKWQDGNFCYWLLES